MVSTSIISSKFCKKTYEIIDPKDVGQKDTIINIGAQWGIKGIEFKLK